ncbi:MAG: hypothetical protein COV66_09285 [Nitrospinae bacterium CG11_big_fil_rev_8_21_14_0_20_45_15]|nr:MAG: hypothetical protein COV66_09285 [Nitrospinae bacterium CG11_big_fil_rev_8_21_14_0_20_45_15]
MSEQETTPPIDAVKTAVRFVDTGEGIIMDRARNLMWLKQDTWQMTGKWMNLIQVRTYVEELNQKRHLGFGNWRIPNALEAKSLYTKTESNKDHQGQVAHLYSIFEPGFGFLCWTGDVRNKIQALRFGYRKGVMTYDDIYRPSRGSTRIVRDLNDDTD